MLEESENGGTPAVASHSAAAATELQIVNGGIDLQILKIDGSAEDVKVRQLPISLIDQWGNSQGDEAFLVELLCDKHDRSRDFHLRNARSTELRLLGILQQAQLEQIETIEKRLASVRTEIESLEAKPRWSDTLTEESIIKIRDLGEQLNKKKFGRWATRTAASVKEVTQAATPKANQKESASASS